MHDFFISHSSFDKNYLVDDLVNVLQNMGYSVWYDKNEILAGDNILSEIQRGLSNSYCFIFVATNNFFKSKWTFYESGFFDTKNEKRMIPLVYNLSNKNKYSLVQIFGNRKYLDMSLLTKEEVAAHLSKTLNRIKQENDDLQTLEQLTDIQKRLASYETLNSEIISIKLKEYLKLMETHKDFLILAAKKIVWIISEDLLKHAGYKEILNQDNITMMRLLKDYNIGSVNIREYIDFVLREDSEKTSSDDIIITNRALLNILSYYVHIKYPFQLSFSQIEVAFPHELTRQDFEDMFEIDKKVMREDLIADIHTTYSWFEYNKFTHIGVRDIYSRKIVGYFSILPITDETYEKIISGNFKDKDFTQDSIEQYIFSDFYKIYVAGVGIDPQYQNTGAFIKLYNALIDLFISLAKDREIYISEVLAEASTKQGEKFCKMVGMKKILGTCNDTDIYRMVTIPPEFQLQNRKGKELYELCQKKFEEYRDYFDKK